MLTHLDKKGNAKIVDISKKNISERLAIASGKIKISNDVVKEIKSAKNKKGDVFTVAKIAGIQAAKNTSSQIPLCHPIKIENIDIDFIFDSLNNEIEVISKVNCYEKTGAEMEALNSVTTCLLTIYDMCKALDKQMIIYDVMLLKKQGGKSDFNSKK